MPTRRFQADPGTVRMIIDYPFDEGDRFPADDVRRVHELKGQLGEENTIVWLPHFISEDRKADLSTLIVINYLLERDRLSQVTPNLTAEDRHHAKTQLESRRSALTATLREALRRAYGVISPTDDDLGPRAAEQVLTLARDLDPRIQGARECGRHSRVAVLNCFPTASPRTQILIRTDAGWLSSSANSTRCWPLSSRPPRTRSAGTRCRAPTSRR